MTAEEDTAFNLHGAVFGIFDDLADSGMEAVQRDVVEYPLVCEPGLGEERITEVINEWIALQVLDRQGDTLVKGLRRTDLH